MTIRFSKLTLACAAVAMMTSGSAMAAGYDFRMGRQTAYIPVTAATSQDRLAESAKSAEFRSLLNESFDMSTIGRFALGTYWKSATPAQQKEYMKLFNNMIVKVYSKRFSDYKGQKFEVKGVRKETEKDFVVTSFI